MSAATVAVESYLAAVGETRRRVEDADRRAIARNAAELAARDQAFAEYRASVAAFRAERAERTARLIREAVEVLARALTEPAPPPPRAVMPRAATRSRTRRRAATDRAHRAAVAAAVAADPGRVVDGAGHGTRHAYEYHGCRCVTCTAGMRVRWRKSWQDFPRASRAGSPAGRGDLPVLTRLDGGTAARRRGAAA
jgi:hypothetical protein